VAGMQKINAATKVTPLLEIQRSLIWAHGSKGHFFIQGNRLHIQCYELVQLALGKLVVIHTGLQESVNGITACVVTCF
jgi:hypothetical protein